MTTRRAALTAAVVLTAIGTLTAQQRPAAPAPFKSGVELINVTATVSDATGRFVPGLRKDDFIVYEDDQPQSVTHFSAERVPVSLGIVLDTSGSMAGEKIRRSAGGARPLRLRPARPAGRTVPLPLQQLPGARAGVDDRPPAALAARSDASPPNGGTAMYDAVARGHPPRRARTQPEEGAGRDLGRQRHVQPRDIREVQAADPRERGAGLRDRDRQRGAERTVGAAQPPARAVPDAAVRSRRAAARAAAFRLQPPFAESGRRPVSARMADDRVNGAALRDMTDDSGGRTEIVRDAARSRSRNRQHRRRAQQAVLPRLSVCRKERRPLALDSGRGPPPRLSRARATGVRGELESDAGRSISDVRVHLLATALGLSLLGSFGGLLVASSLLLFNDIAPARLVPWLVSYAVGALLGVALLALLPEALTTLRRTPVFGPCSPASSCSSCSRSWCCSAIATPIECQVHGATARARDHRRRVPQFHRRRHHLRRRAHVAFRSASTRRSPLPRTRSRRKSATSRSCWPPDTAAARALILNIVSGASGWSAPCWVRRWSASSRHPAVRARVFVCEPALHRDVGSHSRSASRPGGRNSLRQVAADRAPASPPSWSSSGSAAD